MVGPRTRPLPGMRRRVYLETFGCQMNVLDSELVRGQLEALGYRFIPMRDQADVILYNTCSVRQQAEDKVLGRLGEIRRLKESGSCVVVGLLGCMAEREGAGLLRRFPHVDLLCGPGELDKLPVLLENALANGAQEMADQIALQGNRARRSAVLEAAPDHLELLDRSRAFDPDRAPAGGRAAYVRITRGCNKFCTYCVVPATRGAEVHRSPDAILEECRRLADTGVIEVTLLGQTVNHYHYVHGTSVGPDGLELPQVGPGAPVRTSPNGRRATTFADLLHRIHESVPEIRRLRFVTSYPRDFGDDILAVMADSPRICRYLHLPVQSGSDRVLRRMNRDYTSGEYLDLVARIREALPDACLAGDLIAGFPGETREDHECTKRLLRDVRYKNCFIFRYSPRPGTAAVRRFPDDVPDAQKRHRVRELLDLQGVISASVHAEYAGRTVEVFVERVSPKAARSEGRVRLGWEHPTVQMSGRTDGDLIVVFDCPHGRSHEDLLGSILRVRIRATGSLLLEGEPVDPAEAGKFEILKNMA